ncbi:MAG: type VI secretion system tip protein VgrG [Deltaproteobacteria bacterium]|jgi:type VI secretion system secreted protein VgrG|nr:type VI secretion system tip protein VgrG [Deltaproteobacteria bacterium]MBW2530733.1 type VI secretion system tip protein VgrG [Deltaproteobacteria bacterium]
MTNLELRVATDDAFDVRDFFVREELSSLFEVEVVARSANPNVDFEQVVGRPAKFGLRAVVGGTSSGRLWSGLCSELDQLEVETRGVCTYRLRIVPTLWLATQRRDYRVYQHQSEPDIVRDILTRWEIEPRMEIDTGAYRTRKYRVQYGESDYRFLCRMLEDAGIAFYFQTEPPAGGEEEEDQPSKLVLCDAPHASEPRERAVPFRTEPAETGGEYVTHLRVGRRVRPGRYTVRDHDYRRAPSYQLAATATADAGEVEDKLERYHYVPGAFLYGTDEGDSTPSADDRGKVRASESEGALLAQRRLEAKRGSTTRIQCATNAHDLAPGKVVKVVDHPRSDVSSEDGLLVVESSICGSHESGWSHQLELQDARRPYRPPLATEKPKALGAESATVVGPAGDEIHTDEFGRVRVHFHWDRYDGMDEKSSCWIHVAQPWSGAGYGALNLPRIGQEVLVEFLGGDPDRPVIVGRVHTNLQRVPYKLPDHKTQSGWRSASTGQTGGYNEIMFEDEAGEELVRVQAERDLTELVKRDQTTTVERDRTATIKQDEHVSIGRHSTRLVGENQREVTGMNRTVVVGVSRMTEIADADLTTVGGSYSLTVAAKNGSDGGGTALAAKQGKLSLTTGRGATITLDGDRVIIKAASIELEADVPIQAKPSVEEG